MTGDTLIHVYPMFAVKFSGRNKAEFFQWKTVGSPWIQALFSSHNIFKFFKKLLPKCKTWTFLHFHRLRRHICSTLSPKFQTFLREAGLSTPPHAILRAKLQVVLWMKHDLEFDILATTPCCLTPSIFSHFHFPLQLHKPSEHLSPDVKEK